MSCSDTPPESSDFDDPLADFEPIEYGSELQRALAEESVESIRSKPFQRIGPNTTVREAIEKMSEFKTASLMVVDQGILVGVFTERDVLERVAEQYYRLADRPVGEFMTIEPTVVYESDTAAAALAAIAIAGHRHVPVLSMNNSLIGVIGPRSVFDFVDQHLDA